MNYLIPGLEIRWGIFTLVQYRTQSYAELMAYRFMIGLFEVRENIRAVGFASYFAGFNNLRRALSSLESITF